MRHPSALRIGCARRGSAMILVVLTAAVAFIVGLTFLARATTAVGVATLLNDHASARQIAETGLALALRSVDETPDWRATRTPGAWIDSMTLLGGTVTVNADFEPEPGPAILVVDDESFEEELAELPTPAVDPPLTGVIGGWVVSRDAAVLTGPTMPRIGVEANAAATDGANVAFISFTVPVAGSALFAQDLAEVLEPRSVYELKVDIAPSGLALLDHRYGFRLLASATVIATSETAVGPEDLPSSPDAEALIMIVDSGDEFIEHTLVFQTYDQPPAGHLRVELFAESSGAAVTVSFDDVRLERRTNEPLVLTATGRMGDASHRAAVHATAALDGSISLVRWEDSP